MTKVANAIAHDAVLFAAAQAGGCAPASPDAGGALKRSDMRVRLKRCDRWGARTGGPTDPPASHVRQLRPLTGSILVRRAALRM